MIPIPNGLLIERKTSVEKGANDGLPVLFSLLHPIGDLCPVVVSQLLTGTCIYIYMTIGVCVYMLLWCWEMYVYCLTIAYICKAHSVKECVYTFIPRTIKCPNSVIFLHKSPVACCREL